MIHLSPKGFDPTLDGGLVRNHMTLTGGLSSWFTSERVASTAARLEAEDLLGGALEPVRERTRRRTRARQSHSPRDVHAPTRGAKEHSMTATDQASLRSDDKLTTTDPREDVGGCRGPAATPSVASRPPASAHVFARIGCRELV